MADMNDMTVDITVTLPALNDSVTNSPSSSYTPSLTFDHVTGSVAFDEVSFDDIDMLHKLGAGGFGSVYAALWNEAPVAVKVLKERGGAASSAQEIDMFRHEVRVLSQVHHPNCLQLLGVCSEPDHMAIITEYMNGGDLKGVIFDKSRKLSHRQKLDLLGQSAQGINYLHLVKRTVHCDLKPANILVAHGLSSVKVADFGLSGLLSNLDGGVQSQAGTLSYMAPEVMLGSPQTFASDVFSFGVIAYEVVTGVRAFAGVDRKKNIASLPPFPPKEGSVAGSTLWRQLQPLIRSCLEIEAADRPTMADILLTLRKVSETMVMGRLSVSVPDLPGHYLAREGVDDALVAMLSAGDDGNAFVDRGLGSSAAAAASAGTPTGSSPGGSNRVKRGLSVVGVAGVGKTVSAIAAVRSEAVRSAFKDGVYYVQLGENPSVVDLLAALLREVQPNGDGSGEADIVDTRTGRARLQAAFLTKPNALLFLDDATSAADVAPFSVLPPEGAVVVTTQVKAIANALPYQQFQMDVLTPNNAVALLAGYAGTSAANLPPAAHRIAKRCGFLPLSLSMIGSMMKGRRLDEWVAILKQLREFDRGDSLMATVKLSIKALGWIRYRYFDLVVFEKDAVVPENALLALWSTLGEPMDMMDVRTLVSVFNKKALVEFDAASGTLTLHDIQREFLLSRFEGEPELLAAVHHRLLRGYIFRCNGMWTELPDDGYIYEYFALHLVAAGHAQTLRDLLTDWVWIKRVITITSLANLLQAYCYYAVHVGHDEDQFVIKGALEMSAHVLGISDEHGLTKMDLLGQQLHGRLLAVTDPSPVIANFLVQIQTSLPFFGLGDYLSDVDSPLLRTFSGFASPPIVVALFKNATRLASATRHEVCVWDYETAMPLYTLDMDAESLVLDPSEKFILVASGPEVVVLNSRDGSEHLRIDVCSKEVDAKVRCMYFQVDGHTVFVGTSGIGGPNLLMYHLASGGMIRDFVGHEAGIRAITVSSDGSTMASIDDAMTLFVWDVQVMGPCKFMASYDSMPRGFAFANPENTQLKIVLTGRRIVTFDVTYGEAVDDMFIEGEGETIVSCFAPLPAMENAVLVGDNASTIEVYDWVTKEKTTSFPAFSGTVKCAVGHPTAQHIVVGFGDHSVKVFDLRKADAAAKAARARTEAEGKVGYLRRHKKEVTSVALSPNGLLVGTTGKDNLSIVWEMFSGGVMTCLTGHSDNYPSAIAFTDSHVITAGLDKIAIVYSVETFEPICSVSCSDYILAVAALPDDLRFVTTTWQEAAVWDLESGACFGRFSGHKTYVSAVTIAQDSSVAVSGSNNGTIIVWSFDDYHEIGRFESHREAINALIISDDNRRLLSASTDRTVRLFDLENYTEIACWDMGYSVEDMSVSGAEHLLFAVGCEHMLLVYRCPFALEADQGLAALGLDSSLDLSGDGSKASGSGSGFGPVPGSPSSTASTPTPRLPGYDAQTAEKMWAAMSSEEQASAAKKYGLGSPLGDGSGSGRPVSPRPWGEGASNGGGGGSDGGRKSPGAPKPPKKLKTVAGCMFDVKPTSVASNGTFVAVGLQAGFIARFMVNITREQLAVADAELEAAAKSRDGKRLTVDIPDNLYAATSDEITPVAGDGAAAAAAAGVLTPNSAAVLAAEGASNSGGGGDANASIDADSPIGVDSIFAPTRSGPGNVLGMLPAQAGGAVAAGVTGPKRRLHLLLESSTQPPRTVELEAASLGDLVMQLYADHYQPMPLLYFDETFNDYVLVNTLNDLPAEARVRFFTPTGNGGGGSNNGEAGASGGVGTVPGGGRARAGSITSLRSGLMSSRGSSISGPSTPRSWQ